MATQKIVTQKINIENVAQFWPRKSDRQLTSFYHAFTTTSPRFYHQQNAKIAKTPSKNPLPPGFIFPNKFTVCKARQDE
jgi:hypothetical protein